MKKDKVLICGILPPPLFGHSAMYRLLMSTKFVDDVDITFLNMHFWTYAQHKKITLIKLFKMLKYYVQFIYLLVTKRPKYVLYNMSWDKMPFLKDFLFCATAIIFGRKIIIHDMGQYVKDCYEQSGGLIKGLMRWLLNRTHACILLGENTKEKYRGLIDQDKLYSVPGAVEDSRLLKDHLRKFDRDKVSVLYFSYLAESKGILVAMSAAHKILKERKNVIFTFVGPFESENIENQFNAFKSEYPDNVEYFGYIQDEEKKTAIMQGADIFIFPTLRDVFGLVLLHAMAEELPIIASHEGTIPEIINDRENGFLIEKGNHHALTARLNELIDNPKLREEMGKNNRIRYLSHYSPEVYGQNMISTFRSLNR